METSYAVQFPTEVPYQGHYKVDILFNVIKQSHISWVKNVAFCYDSEILKIMKLWACG